MGVLIANNHTVSGSYNATHEKHKIPGDVPEKSLAFKKECLANVAVQFFGTPAATRGETSYVPVLCGDLNLDQDSTIDALTNAPIMNYDGDLYANCLATTATLPKMQGMERDFIISAWPFYAMDSRDLPVAYDQEDRAIGIYLRETALDRHAAGETP